MGLGLVTGLCDDRELSANGSFTFLSNAQLCHFAGILSTNSDSTDLPEPSWMTPGTNDFVEKMRTPSNVSLLAKGQDSRDGSRVADVS